MECRYTDFITWSVSHPPILKRTEPCSPGVDSESPERADVLPVRFGVQVVQIKKVVQYIGRFCKNRDKGGITRQHEKNMTGQYHLLQQLGNASCYGGDYGFK